MARERECNCVANEANEANEAADRTVDDAHSGVRERRARVFAYDGGI